jgi:hypothetical protein
MKIFIVSHEGKEVLREAVSDCTTADEYANRHFGSFDFKGHKYEVTIDGEEVKAEPVVEPVAEVVQPPVPDSAVEAEGK